MSDLNEDTQKAAETEAIHNAALKDRLVFVAWIAVMVLGMALLWILTLELRQYMLMNSVNQVLTEAGDERRLDAVVAGLSPALMRMGTWYSIKDSSSRALVFNVLLHGIRRPCFALVSGENDVEEVFPLSAARNEEDTHFASLVSVYLKPLYEGAVP
ncbi:hypothetical protein ACYULU_05180 [Breznakiellaceae bacterium SP9]